MKKILMSLLVLVIVSGCAKEPTDETSTTTTPVVETTPSATTTVETTSLPIESNESHAISDKGPYEFSAPYATDFTLLAKKVPNGPCSGDMTEEMCIEYYGSKSAIPDGIVVEESQEDENYKYFKVNNSLTGNSIEIGIIKNIYDSSLSDVQYSLNENNELIVSFLFDYVDEVVNNNVTAYDIEQRYKQLGGPIYSHTIYHLCEGANYQMDGSVVNSADNFTLVKMQDLGYVDSMEDVDYALVGADYLKSVEFVKFMN